VDQENNMLGLRLTLALALSLDSFIVATALGSAGLTRRRGCWLAVSFGLCDGLATLIRCTVGAAWFRSSPAALEWLGPFAVGGYGLLVLCLAALYRPLATVRGMPLWPTLALPFCLCLDNLVAGTVVAPLGFVVLWWSAFFGFVSATLALLGVYTGSVVAQQVPVSAKWLGGTTLVLLAAVLFCCEVFH
jgi:putative Mn2+ efflux pump MntP